MRHFLLFSHRADTVSGVTGQVGAYGMALPDIAPETASLLGPAPADWPEWRLEHRPTGHEDWELEKLWPERARLRLSGGGWTEIDGSRRVAALHLPDPPSHAIAHPYLGLIAAVAAYWRGWDYFHAGAVAVDGAVWGVLGERGSGKTSTLGFLARRPDVEILCDDVLVLDRELRGYAGPRCTDLREDAAAYLGVGEPLGVVGARERWRAPLGAVEPAAAAEGMDRPAVGIADRDRAARGGRPLHRPCAQPRAASRAAGPRRPAGADRHAVPAPSPGRAGSTGSTMRSTCSWAR